MKHPFWILAGVIVLLILARLAVRLYRGWRALRSLTVERVEPESLPFPDPDDYLDDVFGKESNRDRS